MEFVDGGVILTAEELESIPTLEGDIDPGLPTAYYYGGGES
ncbi:hypothetical protein [Nocardia abscessus]|nr:hypothetical protein [Nocardia abscessus]